MASSSLSQEDVDHDLEVQCSRRSRIPHGAGGDAHGGAAGRARPVGARLRGARVRPRCVAQAAAQGQALPAAAQQQVQGPARATQAAREATQHRRRPPPVHREHGWKHGRGGRAAQHVGRDAPQHCPQRGGAPPRRCASCHRPDTDDLPGVQAICKALQVPKQQKGTMVQEAERVQEEVRRLVQLLKEKELRIHSLERRVLTMAKALEGGWAPKISDGRLRLQGP
ncbi:uncharacterized protein LOC144105749 isoform X2 [Amblyomma americanum]